MTFLERVCRFGLLIFVFLIIHSVTVSAQSVSLPPGCQSIEDLPPDKQLDRALSDYSYGACFLALAKNQKSACDAQPQPAPSDTIALAKLRGCFQLAIGLQDLGVNFLSGSPYASFVLDCAAHSASIPCKAKADAEQRMRCALAAVDGGSMDGCFPSFLSLPKKK